jgi:hypothetical protein
MSSLSTSHPHSYCSLTFEQGLKHVRGAWSGFGCSLGRRGRKCKHNRAEGNGRVVFFKPAVNGNYVVNGSGLASLYQISARLLTILQLRLLHWRRAGSTGEPDRIPVHLRSPERDEKCWWDNRFREHYHDTLGHDNNQCLGLQLATIIRFRSRRRSAVLQMAWNSGYVLHLASEILLRHGIAGQPTLPRAGKCNRGDRRLCMRRFAHQHREHCRVQRSSLPRIDCDDGHVPYINRYVSLPDRTLRAEC